MVAQEGGPSLHLIGCVWIVRHVAGHRGHNLTCIGVDNNHDHACIRTQNFDSEWSDLKVINGGGPGQWSGIIEKGNDEYLFRQQGYLLRAFAAQDYAYATEGHTGSGAYLMGSWEVYDSEVRLHDAGGGQGMMGFCGDPTNPNHDYPKTGTFTADGNKIYIGPNPSGGNRGIRLWGCVSASLTNNLIYIEDTEWIPINLFQTAPADVFEAGNIENNAPGVTDGQCLDTWQGSWEASSKRSCGVDGGGT